MGSRFPMIAFGAMAGSSLRWLAGTVLPSSGFPWTTLTVNIVGCAVLGVLLTAEWNHPRARLWLHDFGAIGFCGGLTTMSTFATDSITLAQHDASRAVTYVLANLVVGISAIVAGARLTGRLQALSIPLEEQP